MPVSEMIRQAIAIERGGGDGRGKFGIAHNSYYQMRDILLLAECPELSAGDREKARTALRLLDEVRQVAEPYYYVKDIVSRMWLSKEHRLNDAREKRIRRYLQAIVLLNENCRSYGATEQLPYLSKRQATTARKEISDAIRQLGVFKRKLKEIIDAA